VQNPRGLASKTSPTSFIAGRAFAAIDGVAARALDMYMTRI